MIILFRNISLALLILLSGQFLLAQDPTEIALTIHNQIHSGLFAEAKSNMLKLKRKLLANLTNPNISIFSEYIRLCEENGWDGSEKEEARYFSEMLKSVYQEKPDKLISQTVPIVKSMCNYNNGYLADIFFEIVKDVLPLEKKLELQYNIAWAYNYSKSPYKAWYKFRDCATQYKTLIGNEIQYARCLNGIAYVNRFIGQDADALDLYREIEPIFLNNFGDKSFEYAVNCDNIGRIYLENFKDYEKALSYMGKAYEIFKSIPDAKEHVCICLNNIACCHGRMGNSETELKLLLEANELSASSNNNVISNIARVYDSMGNHKKALEFYYMLSDSYLQSIAATDYAENCAARNDISGFIKYEGFYLDYLRDVLKANFEEMIGSDREVYLTRQWDCGLDSLFRIGNRTKNIEITKLCYDCLLFHKSISISCDKSIELIVESSLNPDLRNAYNNLVGIKRKYGSKKEGYENTEREFLKLLSKEGNYTAFMDIRWQDIKNRLNKDDIAIEFHVADQHDDNRIYAVVLTESCIELLCLGSSKDDNNIYNLWSDLEPYLCNADNVYFSPDGILNTYPLESYVNKKEGQKFYRLSSTRELVSDYSAQGKNTYIYGGLVYDMTLDSLKDNAEKYKNTKRALTESDFRDLRGAVTEISYLPWTEKEAKNIADLISSQNSSKLGVPIMFLGYEGTEASFKNLHGARPRVIHLSTHGFYIRDERCESTNIDNVLCKTGLLLSGADTPFAANEGLEDGILTAQEISMLDLRGLDLVSLSACETGLGDISSDGVLGLQRGFKKAGAKSLLMSLWEVDDEATSMFMTEFYRNWLSGLNKYDSLERAKEFIKGQKDKGWDDPEYWSAFILLDGL